MQHKGTLWVVSIPIGNPGDITLRALEVLRGADFIICEEFKEARRFLGPLQIEKPLVSLNEHNEEEDAMQVLLQLLEGKSAALIADCGTPLFSDPGNSLVPLCIGSGVRVVPVPGVTSVVTALTGSGMQHDRYFQYGWLSPKKEERRQELRRLRAVRELIVLMDTPYRLQRLLEDVAKDLGASLQSVLAFELTTTREEFIRGTVTAVLEQARRRSLKGEFVLLVDNRK